MTVSAKTNPRQFAAVSVQLRFIVDWPFNNNGVIGHLPMPLPASLLKKDERVLGELVSVSRKRLGSFHGWRSREISRRA